MLPKNDNINIIRYDLIKLAKLICVRFLAVAAYDKKCPSLNKAVLRFSQQLPKVSICRITKQNVVQTTTTYVFGGLCSFYRQKNVFMLLFSVFNAKVGQRNYLQRTSGEDEPRNPLHRAIDETTERFPQIQL